MLEGWGEVQRLGRYLAQKIVRRKLAAILKAKTGLELAVGKERRIFFLFPCVPCASASHSPAFPVPLSQIRHYSIVI
jgi:hypothetical protein